VPVKTIAGLVAESDLPRDFDLVKMDTEGFDLEVVRGMGDIKPRFVVTEFWGEEFIFSRDHTPEEKAQQTELLAEMRRRGYWWSLILYRLEGSHTVQFTANSATVPKRGWGNVFFFRDYEPFIQSVRWCQLVLPGLAEG
jgi:methyltransferase FkbM-like protein